VPVDYRAYPILFVDDEDYHFVSYRFVLEPEFTIFTAASGAEALSILRERDIAVLITDQKMDDMDGIELCERALALRPDTVRMIVTAYADKHGATAAINRGRVARYISKPWEVEKLAGVLRTTIEVLHVQRVMREMELRLLSGGEEQEVLRRRYREFVHELSHPLRAVREGVDCVASALHEARRKLAWSHEAPGVEALAFVTEAQARLGDIGPALEQIGAIERTERSGPSRFPVRGEASCECSATHVIEAAVRMAERALRVDSEIRLELEKDLNVRADASMIAEIVSNLVTNAVEALETSGPTDGAPILVTLRADGDDAILMVTDKGPGIAPHDMARVFSSGFTTKKEGMGCGLSIVRRFVEEDIGGRLSVRSVPFEATTFEVRLPLVPRGQHDS
jgi:signal transduction histidine kinase